MPKRYNRAEQKLREERPSVVDGPDDRAWAAREPGRVRDELAFAERVAAARASTRTVYDELLETCPDRFRTWLADLRDRHLWRIADDLRDGLARPDEDELSRRIRNGRSEYDGFLASLTRQGVVRGVLQQLDHADYDKPRERYWCPSDFPAVSPGVDPFPFVLAGLADTDPAWRQVAVKWVRTYAPDAAAGANCLRPRLTDPVDAIRWLAAIQLGRYAPATPGLAETLAEALVPEWEPYRRASYAAGVGGRGMAADALLELGELAEPALPTVLRLLAEPAAGFHAVYDHPALVRLFWRLTGDAETATTHLLRAVEAGAYWMDSRMAWRLFEDLGPAARAALPTLCRLRDDDSRPPYLRDLYPLERAIAAIERGPDAPAESPDPA